MGRPVVHFEVNGKDGKKLQQFYSEIFGWKIDANNPMNYGVVDTEAGGNGIGGGIAQSEETQVTFYIAVPDPQAVLDQIERMGGRTVVPVTGVPDMVIMAKFADPEGNIVGLVKDEMP